MPVWFGLLSEADFRPAPRRRAGFSWPCPALSGLLFLLLTGLSGTAWGQTGPPAQPKPTTTRKAKIQARKARVKAILAAPSSQGDTTTVARPRPIPAAKPGQRAGSAPTPPVRNISPDPRDPVGPPPPGVRNTGQSRIPGASHRAVPDTLARPSGLNSPPDTSGLVNGVRRASDSLQVAARPKGQIESTINYKAQDSIQFDVNQKVARLYNKSSVTYGDTDLKAYLITINYGTNTMQADGRLDSLKNRLEGRPVLKDKGGLYTAGSIAYNFKSKKAKVTEAVTTQGEGYVSAATIKRMPNGDINGLNGRYTTCNLEHPHFYIQAKKMKVIPGQQVVTGPFNLVIGDIPTPLGFLFGFFPTPNKSRGSGVLIPTFGQAADRGYFLTNGGYYFAPNDYIGVRLTGDIYAGNAQKFGGFGLTANVQYLKRYTYTGGFNISFQNRPTALIVQPDASPVTGQVFFQPPAANSFGITWNHSPVAKPGGGRFSANVNIASSNTFSRQNSFDARRYLSTQLSSNISYAKRLRRLPVNYNIQLNQAQSQGAGATPTMTFTLPSLSVGVDRQYPYQWFGIKPGAGGKLGAMLYEQFTLSYDLTAINQLGNDVPARRLDNGLPLLGGTTETTRIPLSGATLGRLLRNSRNGAQHRFNIGLGSFTVLKYLKLNPGISYEEVWFGQRLNYSYSPVAQAVRIDTVRGFQRVNSYSYSLGLNTAFYGTVVRRGVHKIQAIRHKVTPSVSYRYSPNFLGRRDVYPPGYDVLGGATGAFRDQFGVPVTNEAILNAYAFNSYAGFVYPAPGGATSNALSFGLQNALEMKVRDSKDTTGLSPFKKVDIFRNLDFSISYDFTRPAFKLSALNVVFSTQIAKKLTLNSGAQFDPYQRDSKGLPIDKYLFEADPRRFLRLASASFNTNYSFNPATGKKKSVVPRAVAPANNPSLGAVGTNFYADYVDFEIPWELNVSYSALYTTTAIPLTSEFLKNNPRPPLLASNNIRADGSIKLTENLRFNTGFGYDFTSKAVTFPTVSFFRDLHCWQINGTWIPFGQLKGYGFTIAAKSSLLQDLKLNRNRYAQFQ